MKTTATGAFALVLLGMFICPYTASGQSSQLRNGLPPTTLDSFVRTAAGNADQIYGDEGVNDIPPFFGFTYNHRINSGITDVRDRGLTTGHGSLMPSAAGRDEFIAPGSPGGEWSQSGANNGDSQLNSAGGRGSDFTAMQLRISNLEKNLTRAEDQLVQTQEALKDALSASKKQGLTPAQKMAADIAIDDARWQISRLQKSIAAMTSNISTLSDNLSILQSAAERYGK